MSPEEVVLYSAAYIVMNASRTKKKRRWWIKQYLRNKTSVFNDLSVLDGSFHNFTRMSSTDFEILLCKISPSISKQKTRFRDPVDAKVRLAVTLRYLASGDSYTSLSYTFKVSKQLISRIVLEVCTALIESLNDQIKLPSSSEEWKDKARCFETTWNFPNCIGAIDGKHVQIIAPPNSGSDFFNYKDHFSIVLLAIADADYNLIYVNCGAKGKSSDSGIYQETSFFRQLNQNNLHLPPPRQLLRDGPSLPYVFVGDSAFALSENMMKPYQGYHERGSVERIFNYRLSRCRRIIENVFGVMSVIFRVLRRPIELNPRNAEKVVMACAYLHNFLRRNSGPGIINNPPGMMDSEDTNHRIIDDSWRRNYDQNIPDQESSENPPIQSALSIRDRLAEYFCSEEGSVSWQNYVA